VVVLTGVFAIGLNKLDFATGQDSYIDPNSQVAKDNRAYQSLFGGENMVVLFTVGEGKNLVDLFTTGNVAQMNDVESTLSGDPAIVSVVSPVKLLEWTNDLIAKGTASRIIARTIDRDASDASKALRQTDATLTTLRLGAAGEQTLDNPDWVKFLLFDNTGFSVGADNALVAPADDQLQVRKALRAFMPDPRHAVMAAVLVGNAPLDALTAGSDAVKNAF
jgi:hypothetical protein